jgi:Mrp family chromosome partitioning ATPase
MQNLHGTPTDPLRNRAALGSDAAHVSTDRGEGWPARAVWAAPRSPFAEAFRDLALRLRERLVSEEGTSILVTSALPGEGKTLTACNLALALASFGTDESVALVDFDLRVPGIAAALGLEPRVGMEAVLRGEVPLESAAIVTNTGVHAYPVNAQVHAAHELLARSELSAVLKHLESHYRWVICDSPPLLLVPDAQLVAPHVGACIAVVRAGRTPRAAFREVSQRLPHDRMVGFFLNDVRPPRHTRRHYRSLYYTSHAPPDEPEHG